MRSEAPSSSSYRYPFSPYPYGWYQVGWSDELAVGDVRPLRVFGEDLVLFRTEDGSPVLLEAHCPHLGAHLGEGGDVVGESIRCPFHAWRFGTDGACVDAPYERRGRTPDVGVRSWPIEERAGLLLAGHGPGGAAPEWRMDAIDEFEAPEWTGYDKRTYRIRMHVQELAENVPDRAHFLYVHETGVVPDIEFTTEGATYRQKTILRYSDDSQIHFSQRCFGLGLIWLHNPATSPESLFLTAPTPIDEETVDVRVSYLFKEPARSEDAKAFLELMDRQFEQDGRIWEHKVYRERPRLIDGDGPVNELRRWAEQFY